MKAHRTMCALAEAMARGKGPRVYKGRRAGFYVTLLELHGLYTDEGFNRRGTAMRRHIDAWMDMGWAALEGSAYDAGSALWFPCPDEMRTRVLMASEQCGGRAVLTIERDQWPAIRARHGIQAEIAEGSE